MDTYLVTQEQIAILLKGNETADPFSLVRNCLLEHGLAPWESPEIELFIRDGKRLLLAHPAPPRQRRIGGRTPRLRRR